VNIVVTFSEDSFGGGTVPLSSRLRSSVSTSSILPKSSDSIPTPPSAIGGSEPRCGPWPGRKPPPRPRPGLAALVGRGV